MLILAIYVDDILLFHNNVWVATSVKKKLKTDFDMKYPNTAKECLGI